MSEESLPALIVRDRIRDTLKSALFQSFLSAGYDREESAKLAEIAIGPVHCALQLAEQAYKLHLEAVAAVLSVKLVP